MHFSPVERASHGERLLAAVLLCALIAAVACSLPFRTQSFGVQSTFLVSYSVLLVTTEFLTAVVLYWRARTTGSARLANLSAAYAFSTPLSIANVLLLPDVGNVFVSLKSAAWVWVFWHLGWSPMIAAFALTPDRQTRHPERPVLIALAIALLAIVVAIVDPALPVLLAHAAMASD
jgi:hypothetical protein